ncbi:hypothetical protein [Avibacterium paragallinarum]|uniref:Uncharacterized protein n=1 Tax=Avibacterium paragallinarum TaxID=728 RepID=A0A380X5N7_AVIPA|nr:hypothetical protein [Avibacterium paragallinarum]SUU98531.1 Uncharacterised protein [Avibacterium paragallinarum]
MTNKNENFVATHIEERNTQSSVPLTQQIAEGFNLKVSNKAPSPRPTTPPVNQKK